MVIFQPHVLTESEYETIREVFATGQLEIFHLCRVQGETTGTVWEQRTLGIAAA